MKYYIIAGEKSGDLHASNLMKAIKEKDGEADFRCWGGDQMKAAGGTLVKHYNELAFMGFVEVLSNLNKIAQNMKLCKEDLMKYRPDVVVLVDYAGFNLRIAAFTKTKGIKTFYYISPKIWAWNQKRALKIKKFVDRMFVILPFEEAFYKKYDYSVDFVGNPVLDAVKNFRAEEDFKTKNRLSDKPIIAILPGSRKQEIVANLNLMVEVVNHFPEFQFVVAAVTDFTPDFFNTIKAENLTVIFGQTYDVLANSRAALVTSGTATLETALFKVPQVVCYRINPISYLIARQLIKIKYISLVNLLLDRTVVKEFIQHEFNTSNLIGELNLISKDEHYRKKQIEAYEQIEKQLSQYKASERTAELMLKYLEEATLIPGEQEKR